MNLLEKTTTPKGWDEPNMGAYQHHDGVLLVEHCLPFLVLGDFGPEPGLTGISVLHVETDPRFYSPRFFAASELFDSDGMEGYLSGFTEADLSDPEKWAEIAAVLSRSSPWDESFCRQCEDEGLQKWSGMCLECAKEET
jgi:hypothetical protein